MSSRPLTAWSLAPAWGSDPRAALRAVASPRESPRGASAPSSRLHLGEPLLDALEVASRRWGAGRVGSIYGVPSAAASGEAPQLRPLAGGPSYNLATFGHLGHLVRSGLRLIDADLADAVLLASVMTSSALLIERHGASEVRLWPSLRPRVDAVLHMGAKPSTLPSDIVLLGAEGDVVGSIALAAACLREGVSPRGSETEPDRINIVDVGPGFSVEVAT